MSDISILKEDKKYLNIIDEANACSACYSNLVSALHRLNDEELSNIFASQISIGQHFRGYAGELGIGDCTCCFKSHLKGCPPTADEMIEFFKDSLN